MKLSDRLIFTRQMKPFAYARIAVLFLLLGVCAYLMIRNFFWVGAAGMVLFVLSEGLALYLRNRIQAFEAAEKEEEQPEELGQYHEEQGDPWYDQIVEYPINPYREEKNEIW